MEKYKKETTKNIVTVFKIKLAINGDLKTEQWLEDWDFKFNLQFLKAGCVLL